MAVQRVDRGVAAHLRAEELPECVLKEQRRPDRGDQWNQARSIAEGAVSDPFQQDRDQGGYRHRDQQEDDDRYDRVLVEKAVLVQGHRDEVRGERARHEDLAVGEVDHEQDAVDQAVAERDQGDDCPLRHPEHD